MNFLLLKSLKDVVTEAFQGPYFREPGDPESYVHPRVKIDLLNPKRAKEDQKKDFPLILIIGYEGGYDYTDSWAAVDIACGAYTGETEEPVEAGIHDALNMADRVARTLLETGTVMGGRFSLDKDNLTWKRGLRGDNGYSQPHPFYYFSVLTRWHMPPIFQLLTPDQEIEIYGSGYPDND